MYHWTSARSAFAISPGRRPAISQWLSPGAQAWRQRHPGTFVRLHEFTHRSLAEDSVAAVPHALRDGAYGASFRFRVIEENWNDEPGASDVCDRCGGATRAGA